MRVFVTRPGNEARSWVDALGQRGFDVQSLPLIDIQPAPWLVDGEALRSCRAVMFVSGNAVRHFFHQVADAVPWPAGRRAWAPGPATAAALLEAGVSAASIDAPPPESGQFDSETLWRQVCGQIRQGDRVLIVRGSDIEGEGAGRDWLMEQLKATGAQVDHVAVYVRRRPEFDVVQLSLARSGASDGSVWLFSSSQAIAHLTALLPAQDWGGARALATHPRIAHAAHAAGFGVVCESRPGMDDVTAALESFR
ncbi:MAG: uroporphyrinogen-III synthase [Ramlibacter sp.]